MFLKFSKFNQSKYLILSIVGLLVLLVMVIFCNPTISAGTQVINHNKHIIIVYDNNKIQTFTTTKNTVAGALDQVGIKVSKDDHVEPSLSNKLVSDRYYVNIYRARPVLVVDGNNQKIVNTAATSASLIAKAAGINIYDEDNEDFSLNNNDLKKGNIFTMTIKRAKVVNLVLYSKSVVMRTQATDVKGFLKEKNIILDKDDRVSVGLNDRVTNEMAFRIWREGKQTITVEEAVPYDTKTVKDYDQYIGYKNTQTAGVDGKKEVTYEITIQDGSEISRTQIQSVTVTQPVEEIIIEGAKPRDGLTKSKGVVFNTDSNGVIHRETYYDLNMSVVMYHCGQGGKYTIRPDGVKVDSAGYIIVAADEARYPLCSVIETSLGDGKVYDTGGFIATYPDGFDLATDWSNWDGK